MSIAILIEVYDEMRRLAIAGSVVAAGDFRLKKLIAPLEQAGAKAPVFAKVADAVKTVVNGNEQTSAAALLDLATLVNAILYTQGETGAAGNLDAIETTDLGAPTSQASARVLKPLLEALTTKGAGRLELIRDAHERGAFRDLRLVKASLDAIDDAYGEIGAFIADKVLPIYGTAILPELRAKIDLKGKGGHARRLRLMHALDPDGTRDLVKQALDAGSKEVKVVAIECLGSDPADLSYLLEQAAGKAQEVRQAAYRALSAIDDPAALAVLQKALAGKDLDIAAEALRMCKSAPVLAAILAEAGAQIAELPTLKEKKEITAKIARAQTLVGCLHGREDDAAVKFLAAQFARRAELVKIKGDSLSGVDLNSSIVHLMEEGPVPLRNLLAEAHATLSGDDLSGAFRAAHRTLPAAKVFDLFSPYLTAKVDEKKKQRDPAWAKREAICLALGGDQHYWSRRADDGPALDARWLDVAVQLKHLGLIRQLGRPNHAGACAVLTETFDAVLPKSKSLDDCHEIVASMVYSEHPQATDAFIAAFEKHAKKMNYYSYWFCRLVADLPKSALPRLEALVPTLDDRAADSLLGYLQQLREKP